jgi:transposase-like protein
VVPAVPISYRNLEHMLADRGVEADHTSLYRWVQRFAPELEKGMRRHLRPCRGPWHVDGGTVKLMLVRAEKRRSSSALRAHAAAMAPVTSAQIAKACARAVRYSAPVT